MSKVAYKIHVVIGRSTIYTISVCSLLILNTTRVYFMPTMLAGVSCMVIWVLLYLVLYVYPAALAETEISG